jgi:predicted MFS family arabinose efflux permease
VSAVGWRCTLCAAALMALVAGSRSAFGLFVSPLNTASGIGLAGLSLAAALGQLGIGFTQPLVGLVVDRFGAARVIVAGAALLAMTTALPTAWPLPAVVSLSVVASAIAGSAVGSNGLLLGEITRAVPAVRAGLAVGLVGAGASLGQLVLGPAVQWAIGTHGWRGALNALAAAAMLAVPLALAFRRRRIATTAARPSQPLSDVWRDRRFWRVALSFGVCGFHVGFLGVHMPGVIERCGLPPAMAGAWIAVCGAANIAGSVAIGLALRRHEPARLLVVLYGLRAIGVAGLLVLPASAGALLGFAVVMGATFMATLPPTAQLVARHHGVQRMGTLFGVVMLGHQVGSFGGIWAGGWAAAATGSDRLLWGIDIALAVAAMMLVWPRRAGWEHRSAPDPALAASANN